ncbi:MAG TPA: ATPase, T2SS/T4P/T4SS family [Planctomycetota bacterium]|jgi:type IV pilus assembly protein PilB|nr:ATPase, T2SS/T4P/T4SS family [Planctomycetota bacterium]
MAQTRRKLIGQILKERGHVHEGHVQEALSVQRTKGGLIGKILVDLGRLTPAQLQLALGVQQGFEVVDLDKVEVPPDVVKRVDASSATVFKVVPVRQEGGTLFVALADPLNAHFLQELEVLAGCEVKGLIADGEQIERKLKQLYGDAGVGGSMHNVLAELKKGGLPSGDIDDKEAMAHAAPVVKLLNFILFQAVRDQASDIHLEPFEHEFKVRYRVDGILYEMEPPPLALAVPLISRVKVMANLDIAETRVPQDGRIELAIGGRAVDLRVSTLPTLNGESCVMRVLDRSVVALDLDRIGLTEEGKRTIEALLDKPHGIVLVTGPTGSGKTTTLYSMLNKTNDPSMKIITTEDPVEYDLDGIVQVPINEEIGVTYAAVLRTILRQDPDIILVGETRDLDTAKIAIEASLTGHLVFTTLHTNDAPSAVVRLIDLGVEPYLLAATLNAIVAQRLVRRICKACRKEYDPGPEVLAQLELTAAETGGRRFAYGEGCDECSRTGYRGRVALFEFLVITDRLRKAILENWPQGRLRELAVEEGMVNLRQAGVARVFEGVTTVEEIVRETFLEQ